MGSRQAKNQFEQRCKNFGPVDSLLYPKSDDGNHRRVFVEGITTAIKLELQTLHRQNYYEHSHLNELCKKMHFPILITIFRKVCVE